MSEAQTPNGGSDGGEGSYQVDLEEIKKAQATLRRLHERTVALLDLAADADPDWGVWGLVGAPFAVWYWQYAGDLFENMHNMGEALDSNVKALGWTGEAYEGADDAMAEALAKIQRELDTKGMPG
ncbi:hypothetical protein [Actinoplanes sp. NPDC051851]|uniref:hypothetical protein n=1 Tax=Actinoplanes sp. NPDC051851 TaxID=3154753 RepID=UPI0034484A0A